MGSSPTKIVVVGRRYGKMAELYALLREKVATTAEAISRIPGGYLIKFEGKLIVVEAAQFQVPPEA